MNFLSACSSGWILVGGSWMRTLGCIWLCSSWGGGEDWPSMADLNTWLFLPVLRLQKSLADSLNWLGRSCAWLTCPWKGGWQLSNSLRICRQSLRLCWLQVSILVRTRLVKGLRLAGSGMPPLRTISRQASIFSPWSQVFPTSISQKMTPSAHTSLFSEQRLSTYASGAIYFGEPTLQNIWGLLGTSAISQQPKSMTATRLLTSGRVLKSTLSGFRSRCTIPLLRICLYPSRIWRKMSTASSSGMPLGVRLMYSESVPPYRSSVTKQIQFSWRTTSSSRTTFSWAELSTLPRLLKAAISQLRRQRVTSLSISRRLMALTATLSCGEGRRKPRQTLPVEPLPKSCESMMAYLSLIALDCCSCIGSSSIMQITDLAQGWIQAEDYSNN